MQLKQMVIYKLKADIKILRIKRAEKSRFPLKVRQPQWFVSWLG